jgi:DNA-binding CsgD family transcriptional regulator
MSWGSALRGRAGECAVLDDLVSAIRRGESRSLVLWGEAGIGKTALLGHLTNSASDLTLVRSAGVESEMELAFAGLHQVCAPLFERLDSLPDPQRQALEIVFGLSDGPPPDRFLVGLAVLSLLSAAADKGPLLCVVDDAHWVDRMSALTLAFVARRLLAEPIGIVFATREPTEELAHLPELEVRGVSDGDARALLSSAVQFKLDDEVRDRIIAETRGNPLALLELPRGLTATQLAGFGLLDAEALTGRIEESFAQRLEVLPADTRRLLLVAAAEPAGDPLLLWRAAERLGIPPTAADAAETQGLLAIGEHVTFRHPLARSAVYRTATDEERSAVHVALADSSDRENDPDRRAWHLATAENAPDEEVAAELEASAGRAQARGGVAAAAAFLHRAVALTPDPGRRAERALAAAQVSLQSGAFQATLGLVATAEAGALDQFQRARVDLLRGHVAFASGLGSEAPAVLLLRAARKLEPFSLELARETYLITWAAAVNAGTSAGPSLLPEICQAIRALPPAANPGALDLLLDGLALLTTDGRAAATATLQHAAAELVSIPVADVLRWGWAAVTASTAVWDIEGLHALCVRQVQLVRDAGALSELPIHLSALGMAYTWKGDFQAASSLVMEAESVAAATGSRFAPFTALRLLALQGREAEAAPVLAGAIEMAGAAGQEIAATQAYWGTAVLCNGLARYKEAMAAAQKATSNSCEPFISRYALPELIEAAQRVGDKDLAQEALTRLAATTQLYGNDSASGVEARCQALLSDGATADACYREAIERLGRSPLRPDLARAHLLYGEWLRRENRRAAAGEHLRTAHTMLTEIGMEAFADRARHELEACGEKVRKRTVETRNELTAQELQIARLARDGLSNPEIGARLFLSPRTVEWHLRNVFTKLDIRSRRELGQVLPGSDFTLTRA